MEKPTKEYKRRLESRRRLFFSRGKLESLCDMLKRMKLCYGGRDCVVEKV